LQLNLLQGLLLTFLAHLPELQIPKEVHKQQIRRHFHLELQIPKEVDKKQIRKEHYLEVEIHKAVRCLEIEVHLAYNLEIANFQIKQ